MSAAADSIGKFPADLIRKTGNIDNGDDFHIQLHTFALCSDKETKLALRRQICTQFNKTNEEIDQELDAIGFPTFDQILAKCSKLVDSDAKETEKLEHILADIATLGPKNEIESCINEIKKQTKLSKSTLNEMLEKQYFARKQRERKATERVSNSVHTPLTKDQIEKATDFKEINVYKTPLVWIKKVLDSLHVGDDVEKTLLTILFMGDYLGFTNEIAIKSDAGTGKTQFVESGINFYRESDYILLKYATGAALRNIGDLMEGKKRIILEELNGINKEDDDAVYVIKMLSSDDRSKGLCLTMTRGNSDDEQYWVLKPVVFPANISFTTTYAGTYIDSQLESRMWIIELEMSLNHNNQINKYILKREDKRREIQRETENCLRFWREYVIPKFESVKFNVIIPFNTILEDMFPARANPTARDLKKFKALLEIITKIHYALDPQSREVVEINNETYIVSEPADLKLAAEVGEGVTQKRMMHITPAGMRVLDAIQALQDQKLTSKTDKTLKHDKTIEDFTHNEESSHMESDGFTPKEVYLQDSIATYQYVSRLMKVLLSEGYLKAAKVAKNGRVLRYNIDDTMQEQMKSESQYDSLKEKVKKDTSNFFKEFKLKKSEFAPEYSLFKGE